MGPVWQGTMGSLDLYVPGPSWCPVADGGRSESQVPSVHAYPDLWHRGVSLGLVDRRGLLLYCFCFLQGRLGQSKLPRNMARLNPHLLSSCPFGGSLHFLF